VRPVVSYIGIFEVGPAIHDFMMNRTNHSLELLRMPSAPTTMPFVVGREF